MVTSIKLYNVLALKERTSCQGSSSTHHKVEPYFTAIVESKKHTSSKFVSIMIESNVKSLILLTTGRRLDLVIWEMKNQIQYAGLDLLSLKSVMTESLCYVNSADSLNNYEPSSASIKESSTSKLNEVLFKAVFSCLPTDGEVLKQALGNCVLLRSVYEEEVASAFGTAQLWRILTDEGLSSSISSETLTILPCAFTYRVCYA